MRQIGWWGISDLIGRILYAVIAISLGFIPQVFFNLPAMTIASRFASKEHQKSLKGATVKLKGMNVVMSYKVRYCLMLVPCLYFIYGLIMLIGFRWSVTPPIKPSCTSRSRWVP